MSEASPPSTRRKLRLESIADLEAELNRLRSANCRMRGKWSLPQACRHLALTIEMNLTPPPTDEPTPEETAMKEKFFGMVMSPAGMPDNLPIGNPVLDPPADCSETEIDRLKAAFASLKTYPHKCVKVGRCGPVPIAELTKLHLAHAAHHLAFQEPLPQPRTGLKYADEAAALADLATVRLGYTQIGNWTLPQACWHLGTALKYQMQPSEEPFTPPTPEQAKMLASVLNQGKLPAGVDAPPQVLPPESAGEEAIDLYGRMMRQMGAYTGPWRPHRFFGFLSTQDYRRLTLIHAAHHFANLVPATGH